MARLKRNLAANFTGKAWVALLTLVFTPLYVSLLGVESFGLIGFYISLQTLLLLCDFGLSTTLNRELARRAVVPEQRSQVHSVVRTLSMVMWLCSALIIGLVLLTSSVVARFWLLPDSLSTDTVNRSVQFMGIAIGLRLSFYFYSGGLVGLQRQVLSNAVLIANETLRFGGAAVVLCYVECSIEAYFIWQVAACAIAAVSSAIALRFCLPKRVGSAGFRFSILKDVHRFALGVTGISVAGLALTQVDKLVLSKLLTLEAFGYYSLAWTIASSLYLLTNPIYTTLFPRFTELATMNNREALKSVYHGGCQVVAFLLVPIAVTVMFYAFEIIQLWTGDAKVAAQTHRIAVLLLIGTMLNGLMRLPFAVQLAHGWTKTVLTFCFWELLLMIPLTIILANQYGAEGGALSWVIANTVLVLFMPHVMHRRLLVGEKQRWYFEDVLLPIACALIGSAAIYLLAPSGLSTPASIGVIVMSLICSLGVTLIALPTPRRHLFKNFIA
jgi:O-antigen/teichoic acid export membrane protein